VVARLRAGGPCEGTVLVERAAGLFHVRPKRSRKLYTLPLATVAEMVVWAHVKAEKREKVRAKAARRKGKRHGSD
jgi:hypothetical protein